MASGIAWRLHRAGFSKIIILEIPQPLAVRRAVCFCEAVYDKSKMVDEIQAVLVQNQDDIEQAFANKQISVAVDPKWQTIANQHPQIVIDAILAKKNTGTTMSEAELTIGLGPGFTAGTDVRAVIETQRGPNCGRVLYQGRASDNTGIPEPVMGFAKKRVLRSPVEGVFHSSMEIGQAVQTGDIIGAVDGSKVYAEISGTIRGLIRTPIQVADYTKIGDIEPRENVDVNKISDKALSMGGAVLEAILHHFNN